MDRVEMYIEQATHLRIQRDALAIENAELHRRLNDAQAEIERLTNVGLDAAYGEAIKADEANDYYAEAEHLRRLNQQLADKLAELRRQLGEADEAAEEYAVEGDQYRHRLMAAEAAIETLHSQLAAQQWEPVEDGELGGMTITADGSWIWLSGDGDQYLRLPDNIRLCRLAEGQPATGEGGE